MTKLNFIIILSLFAANTTCYAQYSKKINNDSLSKMKVIFEDDFRHDILGKPPSKWHLADADDSMIRLNTQYCQVIKENKDHVWAILFPFNNIIHCVSPNFDTPYHLPKNFDINYDFVLENKKAEIFVQFCPDTLKDQCSDLSYGVRIDWTQIEENMGILLDERTPLSTLYGKQYKYPGYNDFRTWHHFRMHYDNGEIKCFIDQYRLVYRPQLDYVPYHFSLGLYGPLKLKNVRMTTDTANEFNKILTENNFVTHAILFDVNKSTIKLSSAGFIKQLAEFLKTNPSVNLEIDGYTDNDGDSTANVKLSLDRADEVRKQLVAAGIDNKRLTSKGYGATKPILPNTTPENKANNRRVEFVKQ